MTKNIPPSPDQEEDVPRITDKQRRWFWVRTGLSAVLAFIFVMGLTYPTHGNVAILWALGFTAIVAGYYILSYFKLYR